MSITYSDITQAQARIASHINKTPIVSSGLLNQWLGHEVYFKAECLQRTGAFKLRGASNFILKYLEDGNQRPELIVANSSGNHAQAVSYTATQHGIPVKIFAGNKISPVKAAATRHYGAELAIFPSRTQADDEIARVAKESESTLWIPPFNHPSIIAGQGTAAAEALQELGEADAVFTPCGGGGLTGGSLIATRHLCKNAQMIAAEPLAANDAAESLRQGKIVPLNSAPDTLADGAATPAIGEHTFRLLQQLDDMIEVSESDIIYWTQWLQHLLKLHIEPTCAMTMQAVVEWLGKQSTKKRVLVIISGGNISADSMQKIWQEDQLQNLPSLG